jgi:hypothetical protein
MHHDSIKAIYIALLKRKIFNKEHYDQLKYLKVA